MKRTCASLIPLFFVLAAFYAFICQGQTLSAQTTISAAEAKDHVGEVVTVCDVVASTRYASSTKGKPTFLNLSKPYPHQIFTIVIWGSDRDKFGEPEEKYRDKHICVTGKITSFRGTPEIQVSDPGQIRINTD